MDKQNMNINLDPLNFHTERVCVLCVYILKGLRLLDFDPGPQIDV